MGKWVDGWESDCESRWMDGRTDGRVDECMNE